MKPVIRRILALILSVTMLITAASALSVEDALTLLDTYYLREIPEEAREAETLDELFSLLGDPYTYYMTAEEYYDFLYTVEATEELVGIGVQIQFTEEGMLVLGTIADSSAEFAGLRPGDLIVAVDGTPCVPADSSHQALIVGPVDTYVDITVLREGITQTYTLRRQVVTVPNTGFNLVGSNIGYIDCNSFGSDTGELLYGYLTEHDGTVDHWLLDLQGNLGGYVTSSVTVSGAFLGPGIYLYLKDRETVPEFYFHAMAAASTDPLIILVDSASASASESVAANLRDTNRAIIIGTRTHGKGVAQIVLDEDYFPELFDGDAVKVTAYRFYSTLGNTTDLIGVIPTLLTDAAHTRDLSLALSGSFSEDYVTEGQMMLHIAGQYFFFDPAAMSAQTAAALLSALPPTAQLYVGANTYNWDEITVGDAARIMGISYDSRWFDDVADSPYASEINTLATYQLLLGDGAGNFLPDGQLTRAQVCAMLAQLLHITYIGPDLFDDVADTAWYAGSVNAMAYLGFVEGDGAGKFHPDSVLTQQEFFAILGRMAKYLNLNVEDYVGSFYSEDGTYLLDFYPQLDQFASWAKEETALLAWASESVGSYGTMLFADLEALNATAPITREEAAACMCRMLTILKILPS